MLIEFTFKNSKSFRDEATFSMVAASKLQLNANVDYGNVFEGRQHPSISLLAAAAVYGANASGKSNVIYALDTFRRCVLTSANNDFKYIGMPFLFNNYSPLAPSLFEITFLIDQVQYRYGFEISRNMAVNDETKIHSEWLFRAKGARESVIFERTFDTVQRGSAGRSFPEATPLIKDGRLRRPEALLISLCAQIGGDISDSIVQYVNANMKIISGSQDDSLRQYTEHCLESDRYVEQIIRLIRELDTGISSLRCLNDDDVRERIESVRTGEQEIKTPLQRQIVGRYKMQAQHNVFDADGATVGSLETPVAVIESEGTQKLIAFAGPIADAIEYGRVLIVDELDSRFHPMITKALVGLFQNPKSNPNHAQLIFVTHDTNLLSACRLRRDQIWFVEKDRYGGSHLYSLADFKGVRSSDPFEHNYISGRYGAIPFIGDLTQIFSHIDTEDKPIHAEP